MDKTRNNGLVWGIILVAIGVLSLIGQWVPDTWGATFPILLLGGLAIIFLIIGILTRASGWFIPAGIIGGIAGGLWAVTSPWVDARGIDDGGLFLVVFALGWATIPITTGLFGRERHWWAFIPAAVLAVIGLAVLFGSASGDVERLLGWLWPAALILGGVLLLLGWRRGPRQAPPEEAPVEKHA